MNYIFDWTLAIAQCPGSVSLSRLLGPRFIYFYEPVLDEYIEKIGQLTKETTLKIFHYSIERFPRL